MPSRTTSKALLSRLGEKIKSHDSLGGRPRYDWESIAASMRGVPRGPTALVRAAYTLDYSSVRVAVLELQLAMEQDPGTKEWGCTRDRLRRLCLRVVVDCMEPLLCRRCQGRGHIYPRGAPVRECDVCENCRFRRIFPRELAKAIGVEASQCGKNGKWRKRYDRVMVLAQDWIDEAAGKMSKALRDM